ncbi:MAG: DNA-binding response regulator, partial [Anaerolineae bacterium]
TRAEFLEQAGYQVLKAYTLEQARQLLAEARLHLAILDIRMENDDDEKDVSGLTLAKDPAFRPVPKIMLTGFPSYQAVREALGPALDGMPPAVDYLSKQEGPEALIRAVEQALEQHVGINWNLVIHWDKRKFLSFPYLVNLIEPELPAERLSDRTGELEDLFRKLFYDKRQITFGRLLWHRGGRVCLAVFAYSPEGTSEQRLVTCGVRPQIEQETARYRQYAPKGGTGTVLVDSAETMHFAAMAYDLHEADLEQAQTFEAFYQTNQVTQVRGAITHLFQTTLAAWHQERRVLEEHKNLHQMYCQCANLSLETLPQAEFQQRMQELCREALTLGSTRISFSESELSLQFPSGEPISVSYPNPISYLYQETVDTSLPVVCYTSPGALDEDNVLVGPNGTTWLTDFAQAGLVPLLWDFICMEAAVRFHLVKSIDLQALHHFEQRLVDPARLNERLDIQDLDAPFQKALRVIQDIRCLASDAGGGDAVLYYKGLLFCALKEAAGYTLGLRHTRYALARLMHALLAAAIIGHRLMEITAESASEGRVGIPKGVEVDELNRQVRVKGRRINLSPLEFDLLCYLYKHAGQLCTRRAIVEEVFKDKYLGNEQEASRVNTLVGRLRKKLGLAPPYPPYIETVRTEGYMLYLGNEGH